MKILYALVFALLGAVVHFVAFVIVIALVLSVLHSISGEYGPLPHWLELLALSFFLLLGLFSGGLFGAKFVYSFPTRKKWLYWGIGILIPIILFLMIPTPKDEDSRNILSKDSQEKMASAKITKVEGKRPLRPGVKPKAPQGLASGQVHVNPGRMKDIEIIESPGGLTFITKTQGYVTGDIDYIMTFETDLAPKFHVYKKSQVLDYPSDRFEAFVAFDDLGQALRKGLEQSGRVNSFDNEFGAFNEIVLVNVELNGKGPKNGFINSQTVKAKMSYTCGYNYCNFRSFEDGYKFKRE